MNRPSNAGLVVLVVACLFATTCIQFDDARDEFCVNADPDQQRDICGTGDGGTSSDGGTSADAGTDAGLPACVAPSDCPPQPGVCLSPEASCAEGRCVYALQADGTACSGTPGAQCRESTGQCVKGVCELTPRTSGACEDGDACTDNDTCNSASVCVGTSRTCNQPRTSCYEPAGTCSNGNCVYALKPLNSACDDGIACTLNDRCDAAGSCAGERRVCNQPPNQCHEPTGTCTNGVCEYPYKPVNASCSDENACTTGDVCNGAGVCNAGGAGCDDRSFECYVSTGCDPTFGCQYSYRCTQDQICVDGQCCRFC